MSKSQGVKRTKCLLGDMVFSRRKTSSSLSPEEGLSCYILKSIVLCVPKMYSKINKHFCIPDTQHINRGNDSFMTQEACYMKQYRISISKNKSLTLEIMFE